MITLHPSTAFLTKVKIDLQENSRVSIPGLSIGPRTPYQPAPLRAPKNRTPIDHPWPLWSQKSNTHRSWVFDFCARLGSEPAPALPAMGPRIHGSRIRTCPRRPARSTRRQTPISGHHLAITWPSPKDPPDGGDLDRFRPIFFPTLNAHGLVVLACDLWVFSSNIHGGIQ